MKFGPTLDTLIDLDLEVGNAIFLAGESAIGKSSYVNALAKKHDTKVFVMNCNMLETKEDLNGVRLVQTDTDAGYEQRFFPMRVASLAIQYAKDNPNENPILLADEINRTQQGTTSALLTMHTDKTLGDMDIPDNLRIIYAGNIRGNIALFDEASLTRMSIYHVEPDAETFLDIHGDELHKVIADILKEYPEYIFLRPTVDQMAETNEPDDDDDVIAFDANEAFSEVESLAQLTAPRTIIALNRVLNKYSDELVGELVRTESSQPNTQNLFAERIYGYVGATLFANELIKRFLEQLVPTTSSSNTSSSAIQQPTTYANLESCTDAIQLRQAVENLKEPIAIRCLMYALVSPRDSAVNIVEALVARIDSLDMSQFKVLFENVNNLKPRPMKALLASNTPLASNSNIIALATMNGLQP